MRSEEGSGHGGEPRHAAVSPCSRAGAGWGAGAGYRPGHLAPVPVPTRGPGHPLAETSQKIVTLVGTLGSRSTATPGSQGHPSTHPSAGAVSPPRPCQQADGSIVS